jgi:hypothetical protein
MHPAAEVDPAKVKKIVQFLSFIISLKILAAFAVSLETKDIFSIEEIMLLASKELISICSTSLLNKSFFLLWDKFFLSDIKQQETLY